MLVYLSFTYMVHKWVTSVKVHIGPELSGVTISVPQCAGILGKRGLGWVVHFPSGRHSWFYYTSKQSAPSQMTLHDSNILQHW